MGLGVVQACCLGNNPGPTLWTCYGQHKWEKILYIRHPLRTKDLPRNLFLAAVKYSNYDALRVGFAITISIWCIYGNYDREITIYTVIYSACIPVLFLRIWEILGLMSPPNLTIWEIGFSCQFSFAAPARRGAKWCMQLACRWSGSNCFQTENIKSCLNLHGTALNLIFCVNLSGICVFNSTAQD